MKYSFISDAKFEYLSAVKYYEDCSPGLGTKLITEFEAQMVLVVEQPHSWKPVKPDGFHRKQLRKFPYSIFYHVFCGIPRVVAFAHDRRRPGYWRDRVHR